MTIGDIPMTHERPVLHVVEKLTCDLVEAQSHFHASVISEIPQYQTGVHDALLWILGRGPQPVASCELVRVKTSTRIESHAIEIKQSCEQNDEICDEVVGIPTK